MPRSKKNETDEENDNENDNPDGIVLEEEASPNPNPNTTTSSSSFSSNPRRRKFILIGIAAFVILAAIIATVLVLVVFKPKQPIGYEEYQEDLLAALRGDRSYLGDQSDDDTPQGKALKWLKSDTGSLVDVTPADVMVERYAMAVFYYATDGPNWEEQAGFLTQPSICEWWNTKDEYLLCHQSVLVTDLNFFNNSLGGTIPTEIGLFQNLFWFHLPLNNVGGTIPSEVGALKQLTSLVLASNKLTGSIPATIGNLVEMRTFELENNDITGSIPNTIGSMTHMQTLFLGNNKVSGPIPSEIGRLVNASDLFLQSNDLTGTIPSEVGDMTSLQFVYLQNNPKLTGSLEPLCETVASSNAVFRAEVDCLDDLVTCSCCERC
ncbi:unnamed protein product [Cylindrotheca closterium]|uniref:L domain-like protein n=1 Tax=Cylindrotheca closterium TaxID=2856 RepID=A0AAD2CMB3_9STRA|nr:unnamed protein product [Cylindrotheca closterium]